MPTPPRRPDPEPLDTDDRPVLLVGMALWLVAFVVLAVFFRDDLRRHDATWWLWACGIGFTFGFYGLHYAAKRRRRQQDRPPPATQPRDHDEAEVLGRSERGVRHDRRR